MKRSCPSTAPALLHLFTPQPASQFCIIYTTPITMDAVTPATTTTSTTMLSVPSTTTGDASHPTRPTFNSQRTQDRLREGEGLYSMIFRTDSNLQRGRKSIFKETGLDDDSASEVTDISIRSPSITSPSSQELSPFPSHEAHPQPQPLTSWCV
ncbi:uncharacterized protein TrAFT101_007256 [Trichoderma asperellum]|nr:hypothetical protein TrAFT101_007256 [Trichoderma asperellum]